MKSAFSHVFLLVIGIALLVLSLINLTALQTLGQQIKNIDREGSEQVEQEEAAIDETNPQEETEDEPQFGDLLHEKTGHKLPFGAAEIEGYFTTVKRGTSLDGSTPTVTCSAFVVTDGPDLLMEALEGDVYGTPPIAVIGSEDSSFGETIESSTEENPVKVLVTLNSTFEGEHIGCMRWPFSSIIEVE